MIQYAVYVLPQISVKHWLVLIVLLLASIGGSWGYLHSIKKGIELSAGRKWGTACCVAAYTALILWSTLFLRTPGTFHQANLIPLWSWYQGFLLGNDEIRWQIYFNILLFMPFGFFSYLGKARPLRRILLRGFLLSLFIELCQYMFCLGLFEWDDLLHNTLGCLSGGFGAKVIERVLDFHRLHKMHGRKLKE